MHSTPAALQPSQQQLHVSSIAGAQHPSAFIHSLQQVLQQPPQQPPQQNLGELYSPAQK